MGPPPGGGDGLAECHASESIANRYDPSGRNAADPLQPLVAWRDRRRDAALRLPFQSGPGPHHATRDPRPADDRALRRGTLAESLVAPAADLARDTDRAAADRGPDRDRRLARPRRRDRLLPRVLHRAHRPFLC